LFQCAKTDVKLKQFTEAVLREYEIYLTRSGYKDDVTDPEFLYLVDSYGIAIQDQMMGPLLFSGGNFGLVLREHLEHLAAQHETSPSEMQRMLCFDGAKMRFSVSEGILKRDRKRSSPELSEAPKVNKKQKEKKANEDEAALEQEVVMDKGTRASAKFPQDYKNHGDASGAGPVKKKMESIFELKATRNCVPKRIRID